MKPTKHEQLDIFAGIDRKALDRIVPRSNKTDTSDAAAASLLGKTGPMLRKVLCYIVENGTGTYDELSRDLDIGRPSCSARLNDLHRNGYIVDTGTRRQTQSGRSNRVYAATPAGRALYRAIRGEENASRD